mmetsp:Transcript_48680/g.72236  ORF Transcript_48680/g.72236 Transcript_48680/m.72236 type:complete len:375 (+) Transcript_48680:74-1198(+)|eukprot:CAMPEP_0195517566 /NCGR_PEP_ID=MMETSP0794_2-20130614/11013_1 /TAXON_ID=515487 /ORGANISM="Stephanopyxis turris, Strain CCMP 815" /LENGTH=374 /DNA_ID=CAMNT_0040646387 /DNA_START=66 /DNA_END=1190 /DNA_ORIENTATION=-
MTFDLSKDAILSLVSWFRRVQTEGLSSDSEPDLSGESGSSGAVDLSEGENISSGISTFFTGVVVGFIILFSVSFALDCIRFFRTRQETGSYSSVGDIRESIVERLSKAQRRAIFETAFKCTTVDSNEKSTKNNDASQPTVENEKKGDNNHDEKSGTGGAKNSILNFVRKGYKRVNTSTDQELEVLERGNEGVDNDIELGIEGAESNHPIYTSAFKESKVSSVTPQEVVGSAEASKEPTSREEGERQDIYIETGKMEDTLIHPLEETGDDIPASSPLHKEDNLNQPQSYSDDKCDVSEENVCGICLCPYEDGDVILTAKHCSHCFHKDCILEWLDNHIMCPYCREDMITPEELKAAASDQMGKIASTNPFAFQEI